MKREGSPRSETTIDLIRRAFLKRAALAAGGILLGACGAADLAQAGADGGLDGGPPAPGSDGLGGDAGRSDGAAGQPDLPVEEDPPGLPRYVIAAQDSSAADKAQAKYLWDNSTLLPELKSKFAAGQAIFELRPGTYKLRGEASWIRLGSGSFFKGSRPLAMPADQKKMIAIDPSQQAVLVSTNSASIPQTTEAGGSEIAVIRIDGASRVTLKDFVMQGHVGIQLSNAKTCEVRRVVVSNWIGGVYPAGKWCNMGYRRTGSFWNAQSCDGITYTSCIAHCSSHHGFLIHAGMVGNWIRNITFRDCRALSCGCGLLRGDPPDTSKPYGFTDWSCGFDLQENACVENILVERCYAFDSWKSGIYQEPRYAENPTICGKLEIVDCVSEQNGLRGGNQPGQKMVVREGEQANFFIHTGTLTRCISRGGRKAGYYAMNTTQPSGVGLKLQSCIDCGSEHGFVLEGGETVGVTMIDCASLDALQRAAVLMGKNVKVTGFNVRVKNPAKPPLWLGIHLKLINADSADAGVAASVQKYLGMSWGMPGFVLSGCVTGLPAGLKPYEIRAGSTVNGTGASGSPGGISLTSGGCTLPAGC